MYNPAKIHAAFEAEKNRKAFIYTAIICAAILLLAFIIRWRVDIPTMPEQADLMEINLGNNEEGFGEVQPLKKGAMAPAQEPAPQQQKAAASNEEPAKELEPDDNAPEDAAPITKPNKIVPTKNPIPKEVVTKPVKAPSPTPTLAPPVPKPPKPKAVMGAAGGVGKGNNATEDNGYENQGNKPGGKGDAGDPSGHPDSYGTKSGGKTGGPKVIGNRTIINKYYFFQGDLEKATVYAIVKVSPGGTGTFSGFAKNSSTTATAYKNAIINYLRNVQFDKSSEESTVQVQFNFNVK